MTGVLILLAVMAAAAFGWLWRQGLATKPWLEVGALHAPAPVKTGALPPSKVGLGVFLTVVGFLFALFISAYAMRMQMPDWQPLPVSGLLWLNTGMLVLSSIALQGTKAAARRGEMEGVRLGRVAGGISALAFLTGQLLAWRTLSEAGYFLTTNPANSFFYLINGLHGLHVLGGLVALGRTVDKAWRGAAMERLRLSVDLCTAYWHFLLVLWLVLFALLAGWASSFVEICRQWLT